MDWLTFIVELVNAAGWPIAAVIMAWFFRKPLEELIGRLRDFEYGKLKAKFDALTLRDAAQAEQLAAARQKQLEAAQDKEQAWQEQAAEWTAAIRTVLQDAIEQGIASNPAYTVKEDERAFAKWAVENQALQWDPFGDGVQLWRPRTTVAGTLDASIASIL